MRKPLLLLSYACFLLPAILAGCSTSHQAVKQKDTVTKTSTDPRVIDSIYIALHPRHVVGKDWVALQQSPFMPMPGTGMDALETGNFGSINLVQEPFLVAVKKNKLKKPVSIASRKQGKADQSALAAANPDKAIINDQQVRSDTIDLRDAYQPGNAKQDTADNKEPAAIAISKPANLANPAPPIENSEETSDESKPQPAEDMDAVIGKYAVMISVEPKEITNYPLFRFIDEWYGTEYKWGGEDNMGIDCSAFSQKLYERVYDIDIMRTTREQHRSCERLKNSSEAEQGDLVFFRIHHFRISHVGVYLANGFFVHSSSSQGVVISNLKSKYWRRRFAGCGRIAKNDPETESESIP